MATISAVATAVPPHRFPVEVMKQGLALVFHDHPRLPDALAMVERSGVRTRHMVRSYLEMLKPAGLEANNRTYEREAVRLAEQVAREAVERAGLRADQVDAVVSVSCTGFMIPSLDAHLANRMGMRTDVVRLPITELGCAAGAVALSRARDLVAAGTARHVLVVAVELPSLTFQHGDASMANLVSSALFGDGAAACVVSAEPRPGHPQIVATKSHLFPDSIGAMGFDLRDTGFHILLAREVTDLIGDGIGDLVDGFLADRGLTRAQVARWVLHPGGRRILEGMEAALELPDGASRHSRRVLEEFGNLSSATVLFVLASHLDAGDAAPGDLGVLAAFGPGFAAEVALLRWPDAPDPHGTTAAGPGPS